MSISQKRVPPLIEADNIIRVGGFEGLSLCDWPGEIVATVFCQGCPWDCTYCHNPELLPATGTRELSWQGILAFLETRRGLLDGVVFSGGEPGHKTKACMAYVESFHRLSRKFKAVAGS